MSLIKANAGEYFPVATEDCVYAYTILDEFETENDGKKQKMMRFIAYAVVNDIVNSRYELAKQLDLRVASVDYSGSNALELTPRKSLTPGRDIDINLSMKLYIFSPLNVTLHPIA